MRRIEVTAEQHQRLKAAVLPAAVLPAAVLPSVSQTEITADDVRALEALLMSRMEAAQRGEISAKSVAQIFNEEVRNEH